LGREYKHIQSVRQNFVGHVKKEANWVPWLLSKQAKKASAWLKKGESKKAPSVRWTG